MTGWLSSRFSFSNLCKRGHSVFPFSRYLGLSLNAMTLLNRESGLATASVNSLRTLGCISSCPIGFCLFWFLRKLIFSYRVFAFPSPNLAFHSLESRRREVARMVGREFTRKIRQNSCQVAQPSPCPQFLIYQLCSLVA